MRGPNRLDQWLVCCAVLLAGTNAARGDEPVRSNPPDPACVRRILGAITDAAQRNARSDRPLRGDALTEHYLRETARAAAKLPEEQAVPAFLAAIGIALDDSDFVRRNLVFGPFCRKAESDAERQRRLAVLGVPTMQNQHDKCQHFVVSCLLTALVGPEAAEAAGFIKEQADMRPGGSGFSFADLAADYAGVAYATRLRDGRMKLETATRFRIADFLPDLADLDDGLTAAQLEKKFGSFEDERFANEVKKIRERIKKLPGYQGKE